MFVLIYLEAPASKQSVGGGFQVVIFAPYKNVR